MLPVRFEPAADVIFQPLEDEIILLDMKDQQYFGLDDVGSAMWRLLLEHGDAETVADGICTEYGIEKTLARNDVTVLIQKLLAAGLIRSVEPVSPDKE